MLFRTNKACPFTLTCVHCGCRFELFPSTFMKRKFNRHGLEVFARMTVFKALGDVSDVRFKK